jgi:hypothetical protein
MALNGEGQVGNDQLTSPCTSLSRGWQAVSEPSLSRALT